MSDIIAVGSFVISCIAIYLVSKKQKTDANVASAAEIAETLSFYTEALVITFSYQEKLRQQEAKCKECNPEMLETVKLYRKCADFMQKSFAEFHETLAKIPAGRSIYDLIVLKGRVKSQLSVLSFLDNLGGSMCDDCKHRKIPNSIQTL